MYDNLEIVAVDPNATPGNSIVEEVVDGNVKFTALAVGSKYPLTTPANTIANRAFKCWVDENGDEIADPENYVPAKGYNKVEATWIVTIVQSTHDMENSTIATNKTGSIGANEFMRNKNEGASFVNSNETK